MVKRDIAALNRMFLVMAREAARMRAGPILTGVSREVLDILASMSIEEIERLAEESGASMISMRLTAEKLKHIIELDANKRKAYVSIVLAEQQPLN
jgi:hypothetical protein